MQTAAPGLINPFAQVASPSQPQPGLYGYNVTSANQLTNPFAQMTVSSQPSLNVGSPSQPAYLSGMSQPGLAVGSPSQPSYLAGTNGSASFNMYGPNTLSNPQLNNTGFGATQTTSPTSSNNTSGNPFAAPEPAPRNPFSDDFSAYKVKGAEDFSKMSAEEIDQFTTKQRNLANTFGKYFYDETPGANNATGHRNNAPPPSANNMNNNGTASVNSNPKLYANPFDNQPANQFASGNYNVNVQNGASFGGNFNSSQQPFAGNPGPQVATSPPKNVNPFL